MTIKSNKQTRPRHARPRHVRPARNFFMESLGFIENPSVSYVSTPSRVRHHPSQLVSTATQPAITVEEMWDTTELHADSMADWMPSDMDRHHLGSRLRWRLIVAWLLLLASIGAAGYWLYGESVAADDRALDTVVADAQDLEDALFPFAELSETVSIDEAPSLQLNEVTVAVDDASRELFGSSADLQTGESRARASATEASTRALEATKTMNTTVAYLGAVAPILSVPDLVTDPDLVELTEAASNFSEWIGHFESVREVLPDSAFAAVSAELATISAGLEEIQSDYLDGLREKDGAAANAAIVDLGAQLTRVRTLIDEETATIKREVVEQVESARESIRLLTG